MLVACVALTALIGVAMRYENEDLFLAFAVGRDILNGKLTAPDHWSFTWPAHLWVNQAWLSHLGFYLSYDTLGALGPVLIKAVLVAACLGLVFGRCRRLGASAVVSLVGLYLGALSAAPFLGIRPENFGVFFFLLISTLLTNRELSPLVRRIGIPAVLAIWSNCHGSAMLGLALLGAKSFLATTEWVFRMKSGSSEGNSSVHPLEWWLVTAGSVVAAAVFSPFGADNLLMPFRQLGTEEVTTHSADWLPLLSFYQLDEGLFAPGSVFPFLGFIAIVTVGLLIVLVRRQGAQVFAPALRGRPAGDLLMEAVIAVVTVVLAFKFRRLALFASFSLVPPGAAILWAAIHRTRSGESDSADRIDIRGVAGLISATLLTLFTVFLFCRAAVIPYVPSNPLRGERSVVEDLMSYGTIGPTLSDFMKRNRVADQVFSGWTVSSYLMVHLPTLQLFMDLRDQSYYPAPIIRDYFTILGIRPARAEAALALLDTYRVSTVVLTTNPIDFNLASRLMQSKRWSPLYADHEALVLVRSDSSAFGRALREEDLRGIWYPNADARLLTRAFLDYFQSGRVSHEIAEELKRLALNNPQPNLYTFIASADASGSLCPSRETLEYLRSEAVRLSLMDPWMKEGPQRAEALEIIYGILKTSSAKCGDPVSARRFGEMERGYGEQYRQLRRFYLGVVF